jgi:hypothetical protein
MPTCTCPKHTVNGALQTAALDVFCPVHGRQPSSGCAGCQARDIRIAELEEQLRAFTSIVQTPKGQP